MCVMITEVRRIHFWTINVNISPYINMVKNKDAELNNPCLKEQEMSFRCLHDNNFEHQKCELFFLNYKNCREFWTKVQLQRRREGLYPTLPNVEDRPRIKAEYMKTKPDQ